ncbi:MAG: aminotransferase class III-fold pyridoxal phosphate-dependent enzyme [Planctomycetes bacterium]|nr:aminotransferase class III-fold pyridoxal phosphate-dependent enzyme [Planctomycetota bacterium]
MSRLNTGDRIQESEVRNQGNSSHLLKAFKTMDIEIVRGEGCFVYDKKGKKYLDMYAGHAVASTGHCHPRIVSTIKSQAEKLIFYSTSVNLSVRAEAASKIVSFAPPGLQSVFFVNSGTEANESALRLAVAKTGRRKIIAMENSFHGRTLLSLNATGTEKYRKLAPYIIEDIVFAKFGDADDVISKLSPDVAAVILEPVQSMAGAVTAGEQFFVKLRKATKENGAFLIFDEVQTAPGRTGDMYFAGKYKVVPDMITLAKGIASGIPAGAVVVSSQIADGVAYGELGSTFGGGPLACSVICATYDVVKEKLSNVRECSIMLFAGLRELAGIKSVGGAGLLIGVTLSKPAAEVQDKLLKEGVIVGTANPPDIIRLLPPLIITPAEVELFLSLFAKTLRTV